MVTGFEPVMKVLQTSALPLGYTTMLQLRPSLTCKHDGVKVTTSSLSAKTQSKGGRWESNPRVPDPQTGVLTTSPLPPRYSVKQG
ncbi:hypothetical protein FD16_GL001153 [Paucilactobacillus suebicus DSM 5007 = KCTC 3549]|uniref:Uncharacterized protein n=1 Tax=Paucilactobacillus suebicus DSM 5007 = KCTC 3549 TaxID=1423807 RepID=A0A0R1VYL7_9LACO|nr:hypothetical protein FD16_GL001153 [Paucilactobacillus suebicus DSM 5007 = KCTC 3549]